MTASIKPLIMVDSRFSFPYNLLFIIQFCPIRIVRTPLR